MASPMSQSLTSIPASLIPERERGGEGEGRRGGEGRGGEGRGGEGRGEGGGGGGRGGADCKHGMYRN